MNAKSEREAKIRFCALKQQYRLAWRDPKSSPCLLAELLMQVETAAKQIKDKGNTSCRH